MKKVCKILEGSSFGITDTYVVPIEPDLSTALTHDLRCAVFPKTYDILLRDKWHFDFTIWIATHVYSKLPDTESPFYSLDEIKALTAKSVFLGFGHTILSVNTHFSYVDLFYLFFQKEDQFFEVIFTPEWKNSDKELLFYYYETDSIHDLSIGEVDVFESPNFIGGSTSLDHQIQSLDFNINDFSLSFRDGSYATFYFASLLRTDLPIYFQLELDPSVASKSVFSFCFLRDNKLVNIETYAASSFEKHELYKGKVFAKDLKELLQAHQEDCDEILFILSKDKVGLDSFQNIDLNFRDTNIDLPFANSYYSHRRKMEKTKDNQLLLLKLIKYNFTEKYDAWKLRTDFTSGEGTIKAFVDNYLLKWNS